MRKPFKTDPGLAGLLNDYKRRLEILERHGGGTGYAVVNDVDTMPPVISNVTSSTTTTSATITFITDEAANGTVWYGTTSTPSNYINTGSNLTYHQVTISNLVDATTYYFYIVAVDPSGNTTTSPLYTFITVDDLNPDPDPPPTGGGEDPPPTTTDEIIGTYEAEAATLIVITDPAEPPPGTGTGKFEIDAQGRILDPTGTRWRGLGANGSVDVSGGGPFIFNMPVPAADGGGRETFSGKLANLQQWGWNFIRCVVLVGGYGQATTVAAVKALVNMCAPAGIVVNVYCIEAQTPHSANNAPNTAPFTTIILPFYQALLAECPNQPYLWLNVNGENDETGNYTAWKALNDWTYSQIRAMPGGANNMMVHTTYNFGQSPMSVSEWNTFASGKHHVVMDWHSYAALGGAATYEGMRQTLRNGNVPFVVSEFGWQHGGGTCCGATYENQRAVGMQNIDSWYATHGETISCWIGTSDTNTYSGYTMRDPSGGYLANSLPLSEMGQKMWNVRNLAKNY